MTDSEIIKILRQHFNELVSEGHESTDLYVGKSETFISFARSIIENAQEMCPPCDVLQCVDHLTDE